jgi:hypothetical protein
MATKLYMHLCGGGTGVLGADESTCTPLATSLPHNNSFNIIVLVGIKSVLLNSFLPVLPGN